MSKRIVVIEDDEDVRTFIREALESAGYLVLTPASFTDAIAVLAAGAYDLIVTDHNLREWRDGGRGHLDEELHPHFRAEVPVLFTSAGDTSVLVQHALPGRRYAHIRKPIDLDQFFSLILKLILAPAAA